MVAIPTTKAELHHLLGLDATARRRRTARRPIRGESEPRQAGICHANDDQRWPWVTKIAAEAHCGWPRAARRPRRTAQATDWQTQRPPGCTHGLSLGLAPPRCIVAIEGGGASARLLAIGWSAYTLAKAAPTSAEQRKPGCSVTAVSPNQNTCIINWSSSFVAVSAARRTARQNGGGTASRGKPVNQWDGGNITHDGLPRLRIPLGHRETLLGGQASSAPCCIARGVIQSNVVCVSRASLPPAAGQSCGAVAPLGSCAAPVTAVPCCPRLNRVTPQCGDLNRRDLQLQKKQVHSREPRTKRRLRISVLSILLRLALELWSSSLF